MKRFLLTLLMSFAGLAHAECREMSPAEFAKKQEWKGRTLIASASWCSSCKEKLQQAQAKPDDFVILVAFDTAEPMEKVLKKFSIASPCIYGEDLVKELKIDALPWHSKI